MILVAIIALSAVVLVALAAVLVGLPDFPDEVTTYMLVFEQYLNQGAAFVLGFFNVSVIRVLFGITVTVYTVYVSYKLIMWVVKKIPMFGVSD